MIVSKNHWFAKFEELQTQKVAEPLWSDRSGMVNQIHYRVCLLSLAKQRNGASFIQIYHCFFKCALTSNGDQLSILYKHFLNIIVVYAIGVYKIEWAISGEFISYILDMLKIRQNVLQQLTSKWIDGYLKTNANLFSRIFMSPINKQLWTQINNILKQGLNTIAFQNWPYFYNYQSKVLPIFYMEYIKKAQAEEDRKNISPFINQFIQNNLLKLQQVVKIFPHRKVINYQQFITKQAQYFHIKELSAKQRNDIHEVDQFYWMSAPNGRTLHQLIHDVKHTHKQKDLQQKINLFATIVKEAELYKSKTGLYYPFIDTDIIINQAQNRCSFTIEKPLLFQLGLSNPQPKTVQMEMCEPTPEGFLYQPLFLSPEQVLKKWSFEKHLFISERGEEGHQIETDQERSHVYRLLLIGYQILSGQNMLNNGVYLQSTNQQKSVQQLAKQVQSTIKSDGFKLEDYLPGIELKRELKTLKFDFSFKKLLQLVQIVTDDDSLVKAGRFDKLQKIEHLRLLLIKRAVYLLSHPIYFKRLFNTKKYIIIFFLACAMYMHLLFLPIVAEEYRPGGAGQLRHAIRELIVTIIRPAKKDNYMEMGYKKIFEEYKGRHDNQQIYMKKIQYILNKMKEMHKAVQYLKKLEEQTVRLEVQIKTTASQQCKSFLSKKRAEMRAIIMQNYDTCISILSQFNQNEFFKHRYQLDRYHKKNIEIKGEINSDVSRRSLLESLNIKLYLTITVFLKISSYNFAHIQSCVLPLLFSKTGKQDQSLHMKRTREIQTIDEEQMSSKEMRIGLQRLNAANEVLQTFKDYKISQQFKTPIDKYACKTDNPLKHYSPYQIECLQNLIWSASDSQQQNRRLKDKKGIQSQQYLGNNITNEQDDYFWERIRDLYD